MTWPPPTGRQIGARLISEPDHGKVVRIAGTHMRPTPYIDRDNEIRSWNGAYEWARDYATGEIIGVWHTGW